MFKSTNMESGLFLFKLALSLLKQFHHVTSFYKFEEEITQPEQNQTIKTHLLQTLHPLSEGSNLQRNHSYLIFMAPSLCKPSILYYPLK